MKRALILLIILYPALSFSQDENPATDSLKKYSYLLSGHLNEHTPIQGTCFFIKEGDKTLLITAAEIIGNWDALHFKDILSPDVLNIRLYNKTTGKPAWFKLNFTKAKKEFAKIKWYQSPDVYALPIDIPAGYDINPMTQSLKVAVNNTNPKRSVYFGYPKMAGDLSEQLPATGYGRIKPDPRELENGQIRKYDTMSYSIAARQFEENTGFSGSPLFWELPNGNIVFRGIVWGADAGNMYLIKPEQVSAAIAKNINYEALHPVLVSGN